MPAVPDGKTVTPINDVTIWQQCAGIANTTYTTLADILADSSILSTLITDNNAVDYMVRSTSFATSVCANQNAMQYIGATNYCPNTLLADSDWCAAICNSTYFESVLNAKIPTMTSDTTPSGECIKSGVLNANTQAYKAFDNNSGTYWCGVSDTVSQFVGYDFGRIVGFYKVYVYITSHYGAGITQLKAGKVQLSEDGQTWNTIHDYGTSPVSGFPIINTFNYSKTNARYFRFFCPYAVAGGGNPYYDFVQFNVYGREDV